MQDIIYSYVEHADVQNFLHKASRPSVKLDRAPSESQVKLFRKARYICRGNPSNYVNTTAMFQISADIMFVLLSTKSISKWSELHMIHLTAKCMRSIKRPSDRTHYYIKCFSITFSICTTRISNRSEY